jgi:hypothetical protein
MATWINTPRSFVSDVSGSELSTAWARWHKIVIFSVSLLIFYTMPAEVVHFQ